MKKLTIFTNGCFDVLHCGHIHLFKEIKKIYPTGILTVGLNSDKSVKLLKGKFRPINSQQERKIMLSAIKYIDNVIIFDERTPFNLITEIKPDILVKGFDYYKKDIVGHNYTKIAITIVNELPGYSTTELLKKIVNYESYCTRVPNEHTNN